MTDVAHLGGGYADSEPDPQPTVDAVLAAAHPGSPAARLIVVAGPPGVGKSAVAARLVELLPNAFWLDKDITAANFILAAARAQETPTDQAYGTPHYWQVLRPLEYAGPTAMACANLVGTRQLLLVGGWGPELAVPALWTALKARLAPSQLRVVHLDAPPLEVWRQRLHQRGSRSDSPWFENFAAAVTRPPVWDGAARLATDRPLHQIIQAALNVLG